MVALSVLDLATVCEGDTASAALRKSLALAQRAESLGYQRFWVAEHHSMPGVASAATAVVIAHLAAGTSSIRVGAGGIMLPNHPPLVIAEQFGTLESLHPGRIDLGLGRAPGSAAFTQRALRRPKDAADRFVDDLKELQYWFREKTPEQRTFAMPGAGLSLPLWILGSSTFGGAVAAEFGLPYAFASHFAPAQLDEAVALYRARFKPSHQCEEPHLMLALNAVAAPQDSEAQHLFSSLQQAFVALSAGAPKPFPPPRDFHPSEIEQVFLHQALQLSVVGSVDTVAASLASFVERHRPQELIITVPVFEFEHRLRSLELTAEAARHAGIHPTITARDANDRIGVRSQDKGQHR